MASILGRANAGEARPQANRWSHAPSCIMYQARPTAEALQVLLDTINKTHIYTAPHGHPNPSLVPYVRLDTQ
jgi:hypothetical protein